MNNELLKFKSQSIFAGVGFWVTASTASGLAFAYFVAAHVPQETITIWIVFFLAANALRMFLYVKYVRGTYKSLLKLQRAYLGAMIFTGIVWGAMSFITINKLPISLEAIYVGFVLAVTANGAISVVADRKTSYLFAIAVVLPYTIKTIVEVDPYYIPYSFVQGVYLLFIFSLVTRFNRELNNNAELVIEKENLLVQLTEKFDLERQLKEEKLKSLQASKYAAIGEMAAGVGHEVNNPLTIVLGYLWKMERILDKKEDSEELKDLVTKCSQASKRIAEIVKTMRDFANVRGRESLETFSLSAVVKMVKPLAVKTTAYEGVDFSFSLKDCQVQGNQSEFAQALYNLVSNAAHAAQSEDEAQKLVEISSDNDEEYVYLRVANSGSPIPDDVVEKMFQPFYTTKEVGKGAGLGLSLAKTIMENNRGELIYDRVEGKTLFTMKMVKAK